MKKQIKVVHAGLDIEGIVAEKFDVCFLCGSEVYGNEDGITSCPNCHAAGQSILAIERPRWAVVLGSEIAARVAGGIGHWNPLVCTMEDGEDVSVLQNEMSILVGDDVWDRKDLEATDTLHIGDEIIDLLNKCKSFEVRKV
jgi:hypothetical protein